MHHFDLTSDACLDNQIQFQSLRGLVCPKKRTLDSGEPANEIEVQPRKVDQRDSNRGDRTTGTSTHE